MAEQVDYRSILRSSPDLYLIIAPDLRIIDASDTYLKATMVNREDIIDQPLFEVFPDNPNDPNATGVRNLNHSLQTVFQTKLPHRMNVQKYDIRSPNSAGGQFEERYWIPINTPVLNNDNEILYIIHRAEDITKLHQIQQSSIEYSKRFELLVENIKDYAIIMLDTQGVVSTWNTGAQHIVGYTANEMTGHSISLIYPGRTPVRSCQHELKIAKEKGRYEDEGWRIRKDGSRFWTRIIITPIYVRSEYDACNHFIGYGKVLHDLTSFKEIEKVKDGFISVINHELRTPITSILGAIRLLLNWTKQSAEKNNYLLEIANANCDRLLQLINDILDIDRLHAGGMALHLQQVNLSSLVIHAVSMNQVYAEQFGVSIDYISLAPEVKVCIDSSLLIQVLTNLITNAAKFALYGSQIKVCLSHQNQLVRIAVTNRGKGVPDNFKSKIFEKFSQADVSTTRSDGGTGLGLAISKKIIEQLGSTLEFISIPNEETTFYFDLPVIKGGNK